MKLLTCLWLNCITRVCHNNVFLRKKERKKDLLNSFL